MGCGAALLFAWTSQVCAQTDPASAASGPAVDFANQVRPILERHCFECHGSERQESGYRLDVRDAGVGDGGLW